MKIRGTLPFLSRRPDLTGLHGSATQSAQRATHEIRPWLKPLRFNDYNKIYPVVVYFEANFGTFRSFEGTCKASGDPKLIFSTFHV
jgi:hypothetical protein